MNHEEVKNILLQDPQVRKAYENPFLDNPRVQEVHDNPPIRFVYARAIVKRRHELGMTQIELAEKMGSSQTRISTIERGIHMPGDKTLDRLGEALGCTFVVSVEAKED